MTETISRISLRIATIDGFHLRRTVRLTRKDLSLDELVEALTEFEDMLNKKLDLSKIPKGKTKV